MTPVIVEILQLGDDYDDYLKAMELQLQWLLRNVAGIDDGILKANHVAIYKACDFYRNEATKSRGPVTPPSLDLLEWTQLDDLRKLLVNAWTPKIEAVLGQSKNEVQNQIKQLIPFRNAAAHHNTLLMPERALAIGLSDRITRRIVEYRANMSDPAKFYPVLVSAVDSLGRVAPDSGTALVVVGRLESVSVGDVVTFDLEAADHQARDIEWSAKVLRGNVVKTTLGPYNGSRVTIKWTVLPEHIGEQVSVRCGFEAAGATYHRLSDNSGVAMFRFTVYPKS